MIVMNMVTMLQKSNTYIVNNAFIYYATKVLRSILRMIRLIVFPLSTHKSTNCFMPQVAYDKNYNLKKIIT